MIDLLALDTNGKYNSGFGHRDSPTAGASSNHKGVDVTLKNDNIPAVVGGTVLDKGTNTSAGNWIKIKQSDGLIATYMHLAALPTLSKGTSVNEGQTIGIQGNTGISTGKHLHFQVQDKEGNYINPETYLSTGGGLLSSSLVAQTLDGSTAGNYLEVSSDSDGGFWATVVRVVAYVLLVLAAAFFFLQAFDIKLM